MNVRKMAGLGLTATVLAVGFPLATSAFAAPSDSGTNATSYDVSPQGFGMPVGGNLGPTANINQEFPMDWKKLTGFEQNSALPK